MLLNHKYDLCNTYTTNIREGKVVKHIIKNFTPYSVYSNNKELLDSFGDTLTNYSPISINIIDYWNKENLNTSVYDKSFEREDTPIINFNYPFGYDLGSDPDMVYGFAGTTPQANGYLVGQSIFNTLPAQPTNTLGNGECLDKKRRYYINSLIGVQDKLAYTYMNGFYSVTQQAKVDTQLRYTLFAIAKHNGVKPDIFFKNTNVLFNEQKSSLSKEFITNKGTDVAIKYATRSAHEAELQGKGSHFNIDIIHNSVFDYTARGSVLTEIFERFVKPLAHPIGMIYDYKSICKVQDNIVDHPLMYSRFRATHVSVNCLCTEPNKCGGSWKPEDKVFATEDGQNLWEGISIDEAGRTDVISGKTTFNILVDYRSGQALHQPLEPLYDSEGNVIVSGDVLMDYRKYIFESGSYLIVWHQQGRTGDEAPKSIVEYHRLLADRITYVLVKTFNNGLHCDIRTDMISTKRSQITENFYVGCRESKIGTFEFGTPLHPKPNDENSPDTDGKYRGYITRESLEDNTALKKYGGRLYPTQAD